MQTSSIINFPSTARLRRLSDNETREVSIPSTVHDALFAAGSIPDPFYRLNETGLQWIEAEDWEYSFDLVVPPGMLADAGQVRELCFLGLDTYAEVRLNGNLLGETANMFHPHVFADPQGLREGKNSLQIRFRSPHKVDIPKARALGYPLPSSNEQSEIAGLGDLKIAPFARKAPYQYGWDWGPRFVTMGMWRSGWLRTWTGARLDHSWLITRGIAPLEQKGDQLFSSQADVQAVTRIKVRTDGHYLVRHTLNGLELGQKRVFLRAGEHLVSQDYRLENPALWWCNGMGNPDLHDFATSLFLVDDKDQVLLDRQESRVGIRTLRLLREKDEYGKSFQFEINGLPVFARGANYIPNHNFPAAVQDSTYRHILGSARDSHMNMLRVWGGGYYENPVFYELCDQYGIMVWQDFMFACAMYPGDEAFLQRVQTEATLVVRQLRGHACLALWCGNNEIDSAWRWDAKGKGWNWKESLPKESAQSLNEAYDRIFHHMLPDTIRLEDPERPYWPSSPQADWYKPAERDSGEGDMHYWGVWHGDEPFENYQSIIPRFMSEYGFQSFPEPGSLRRFALLPEDEGFDSQVMKAHQRSPIGNGAIKRYMEKYLRVPGNFDDFILASQILQAEAIRSAILAHRMNKPRCMGSLYWQLNDCWPAASWSSIDFYGRWKALHYHVRRVYRPVVLSLSREGGVVHILACNDGPVTLEGRLILHTFSLDGSLDTRSELPARLDRNTVHRSGPLLLEDIAPGHDARDLGFLIQFDGADSPCRENYAWLEKTRDLALQDPQLQFEVLEPSAAERTVEGQGAGAQVLQTRGEESRWLTGHNIQAPVRTAILKLTCRKAARFVHPCLDNDHPMATELWMEDDWFDLYPGEVRYLRMHSPLETGELRKLLRLRSAWDICPGT